VFCEAKIQVFSRNSGGKKSDLDIHISKDVSQPNNRSQPLPNSEPVLLDNVDGPRQPRFNAKWDDALFGEINRPFENLKLILFPVLVYG
jgi:hypothetical protein